MWNSPPSAAFANRLTELQQMRRERRRNTICLPVLCPPVRRKKLMRKYDYKINAWQVMAHNFPRARGEAQKLAFLLRYAVLAPSSHNTQPWKFAIGRHEIVLFVNKDRWLRVADTDQRELYTSIGCALENLLIAAEHFGYRHHVTYFPEPANLQLIATVEFLANGQPAPFRPPELFEAINCRHTNHKRYEDRQIADTALQTL